ncbi:hypothetical protein ABZR88_12425 [Mucilaginibacter yixingensis]
MLKTRPLVFHSVYSAISLNHITNIIYELKPFNPKAVQQGLNQLINYMMELQAMPRFSGKAWETV